jgi:hypothetical protein
MSNAEIAELNRAHEAGMTDASAVVLIHFAREHKQPFDNGQNVADLLNAGSSEETVVMLARLNLLGPWAGEARAIRLEGISDKIVLAVARRKAQNLPVLSGEKLGELKNTGVSDAVILEMVEKAETDARANISRPASVRPAATSSSTKPTPTNSSKKPTAAVTGHSRA